MTRRGGGAIVGVDLLLGCSVHVKLYLQIKLGPDTTKVKDEKSDDMDCNSYEDIITVSETPRLDTSMHRKCSGLEHTEKTSSNAFSCYENTGLIKCKNEMNTAESIPMSDKDGQMANKIQCSVCEEKYDNITEYTHHLNMHLEDPDQLGNDIKCYTDLPSSKIHQDIKAHILPSEISNGSTEVRKKSNVQKEINLDNPKSKNFSCTWCNKSFGMKSRLTNHIDIVHLKLKPFSCSLCDRSFAMKINLTEHIISKHYKVKPFSCTLCDKSFGRKRHLKDHVDAVHLKLKRFSCTSCNQSFAKKCDLSRHIVALHHTQKPFSCTLCDKSFAEKRKLTGHIDAIHNRVKAFSCTLCDKSFVFKRNLAAHTNSVHHKQKPFLCTLCDKSFTRKYNLAGHFKKFHKKTEPFSQPDNCGDSKDLNVTLESLSCTV